MFFSLLVAPILPASLPLLPITLTLDCKQCTEMLVDLYHICFSKMGT